MIRKTYPMAMILATAGFLAVACADKQDEEKTEETTAGTAANPALEAAGKLNLSKPSAMMLKAGDALASANVTGQSSASLYLGDGSQSENDPLCNNNGEPWDAATGARMSRGNDYAPGQFYCLVNSKVNESLETLPGFFAQQASIICTLEESLELNIEEFTAEGKEYISGDSQDLTLSTDCWPQGIPEDGTQTKVTATSVIGKTLAEATGWQYQVDLVIPNVANLKMRYFSKDGRFGFSRFEEGTAPAAGTGMTAVVDTVAGVVLYDAVSDVNKPGENSKDRRIARFRAKGTFDENLKFSSIDEGRGIYYVSGPGFDGTVDNSHQFNMYTVSGTKADGYSFKTFLNHEAVATVEEKYSKCTDGDCANATDIGTTAEMKDLVFKKQAVHDAWTGFLTRKPMCEPAENASTAVSYSALMPNTGSFGVCE